MTEAPGKEQRTALPQGRFDIDSMLRGWLDRFNRTRPFSDGAKPALKDRARAVLDELAGYLFHDSAERLRDEASPPINFGIYHLEDVLLECELLRSTVLDHIGAKANPVDQNFVIAFFDQEAARLAQEASEYRRLEPALPAPELPAEAKDTNLLSDPKSQGLIHGTIENPSLRRPDRRASLLLERAGLLAEASKVFGASIDYQATIHSVASFALRTIADWCIVDALGEDGGFHRAAVLHRDPRKAALAEELRRDFGPRDDSRGVPSQVLRTHQALLIPEVTDGHYQATARSSRHEQILRGLGSRTYMCVPMVTRGDFLGAITFVSAEEGMRYEPRDVMFAEELCSRAALAIDNAIQFQRAQNAIRLREDFINIVSHDLKNPLNVMNLSTNLLLRLETGMSPKGVGLVKQMQQTVNSMSRLIMDLLDLSKFEAGHFRIDLEEVGLRGLLGEAVDLHLPLAAAKSVDLSFECPGDLGLRCDRGRMLQAVSNLIGNAIKFTPAHGSVQVQAWDREDRVKICVRDSGPGIPPADLPRLFDRFWQAKGGSRKGTGLGLSIVRAMVEAHRGTIDVESVEGQGSRFYIDLPRGRIEQTEDSTC